MTSKESAWEKLPSEKNRTMQRQAEELVSGSIIESAAARVRLNRACKEPGPCPDLEAAYLDLYDEVKRLRATGEIDRKFARKTADDVVSWKSRAEKAEAERADEWTRRREAEASRDLEKAVCATIKAERDALRAALVEHNDLLRSASQIAKREGIDGEIASTNWDAYYNRVAVVLKRHHEISNTARAALKGDSDE